MMYKSGFGRRGCFDLKPVRCAVFLMSTAVLSGCSADVTRFDSASFNLNDPPGAKQSVSGTSERGGSDIDNPVTRSQRPGPYGAGARDGGVDVAALPDAMPPPAAQPEMPPPRQRPLYKPSAAATPVPAAPPRDIAKGDMIEVAQGDTLYGLSRRHQVSLAELMSVNGLTAANLKPGQKLYLPAGKSARMAPPSQSAALAPSAAPLHPASEPAAAAVVSPELAAKYNSSYTVKQGDSIYGIARAHKVPFTELQLVNNITNPLKVKPGVELKVPRGFTQTAAAAPPAMPTGSVAQPATAAPIAPEPSAPAHVPSGSAQPTILNSAPPAATAQPVPAAPALGSASSKTDRLALNTPSPAPSGDTTKLRWPAQGRIIAGFGGRSDGTHNDGVNISVPQGTEVHAAEGGVIAYAGSELKGYGNLVLVRHDNGWVTAYAHNDELLVKRGDKVSRGQIIAKAGKTGTVDQPQVHFELRQGSKPVDPTPFMEKL